MEADLTKQSHRFSEGNDSKMRRMTQQAMLLKKDPEEIIETMGGWVPHTKAPFDKAVMGKKKERVREMLPFVPKKYKKVFRSKISKILQKHER